MARPNPGSIKSVNRPNRLKTLNHLRTAIAILLNSPGELLRAIRHKNTCLIEEGGQEMTFPQLVDAAGVKNIITDLSFIRIISAPNKLEEFTSFIVNITDAQLECIDIIRNIQWSDADWFNTAIRAFNLAYAANIPSSIAYTLVKAVMARAEVYDYGILAKLCAQIFQCEESSL